jgi:signal transduction histidine kinase
MDGLRTFLEANSTLITFVYGLVFFVLGLAIALQSLHSSRLELARSLSWLAAFGFTHGMHEWGDLFIPVQAEYFGGQALFLLHRLHLILLAVSFACLFQFGVALLRPFGWARWLHTVPGAALAVWVFVAFFPLPTVFGDFMTWHNAANALARYFLGFPASLLAAYGLHQHINRWIAPLNVPHIVRPLRLAVVMLVLYAFFSGLVPPPAPFFPANILNSVSFADVLVAPPPVFRSIIGLALALSIIRGLEIFDLETERVIEGMEQRQIVAAERERIGRDLHDGSIQKVYTAGLIVESALKQMEPRSVAAERLETALTVLDDAIGDLRRNLGELQTTPSSQLLTRGLREVAEDPRFGSFVGISLEMDIPEVEVFSAARAEHVIAIANEALSNIVRHARARKVMIRVRREGDRLVLSIQDDGVGLQAGALADYGMRNMRDRAHLLGGNLRVNGSGGKGTTVTLDIPWSDER